MKHIKQYENMSDDEPKVGDYIICEEEQMNDKEVTDFVNSHIAQILKIYSQSKIHPTEYIVKFENVPKELDIKYNINIHKGYGKEDYVHGIRKMYQREIIDWSDSKEELESKIAAKKFNL